MRVQTGERDSAAEVGVLALGKRLVVAVQVLLGQAKVHDVHLAVLPVQHEVRRLHVSVNEALLVDLFDRNDHFDEDLYGDFEVVALL